MKAFDFRDKEQELEDEKEAFLRKAGWKHTSNTPGAFWVWLKDIAYRGVTRTYAMPLELALKMQEHLEIMSDEDDGIDESVTIGGGE